MIKPVIHRNGTSREELFRQVRDAGYALHAAMAALGEAAPNGRDYYPLGPDATTEHAERIAKLQSVHDDLQVLAEHIMDAE